MEKSDLSAMATTCPLCVGADEVGSMVTVEIDRVIPKGRAAILICRSCAGAIAEVVAELDSPPVSQKTWDDAVKAAAQAAGKLIEGSIAYPCPPGCVLQLQGVEHAHYKDDSDPDPEAA